MIRPLCITDEIEHRMAAWMETLQEREATPIVCVGLTPGDGAVILIPEHADAERIANVLIHVARSLLQDKFIETIMKMGE